MYKAIVTEVEGTGAGYGLPPHLYTTGVGVAMGKSPKRVLAHAKRMASAENLRDNYRIGCGGYGLVPVLLEVKLFKNGTLIYKSY